MNPEYTIYYTRKQLYETLTSCEKERDDAILENNTTRHMLASVTKERDELLDALMKLGHIAGTGSNAKEIVTEALAKVGADTTGETINQLDALTLEDCVSVTYFKTLANMYKSERDLCV